MRERPWTDELAAFKVEYERIVESECSPAVSGPLRTKQVVHALDRVFVDGFVLVHENGGQDLWSYYCPYVKVTLHRGCVAPAEQTVMGLGVAGAIGAKLGRPDADVVCVTGDGAFQMYMKEIPTALQHSRPCSGSCSTTRPALGEVDRAGDRRALPRRRLRRAARPGGRRRRERAHAERIARRRSSTTRSSALEAALATGARPCWLRDRHLGLPEGFVEFHRDVWGLELPERGCREAAGYEARRGRAARRGTFTSAPFRSADR